MDVTRNGNGALLNTAEVILKTTLRSSWTALQMKLLLNQNMRQRP